MKRISRLFLYLSLTLFVSCNPFGEKSAINIVASSIEKTTQLEWEPQSFDMGAVSVNKASMEQKFVLTNTGDVATLGCGLVQISDSTNYLIVSDTCGVLDLQPGASCEVIVRGGATTTGVKKASLSRSCAVGSTISKDNDNVVMNVEADTFAVWAFGSFGMYTGAMDWGDIGSGQNIPKEDYYYNPSTFDATSCGAPVLSDTVNFSMIDECGTSDTLAGNFCRIEITPTMTNLGSHSANYSRTCTIDGEARTVRFGVKYKKIVDAPKFQISGDVNSYYWGYVDVSYTSTVTISNNGTLGALSCSAPSLTNATDFEIVSDTCGTSDLPVGSSCQVKVKAKANWLGLKNTDLVYQCANAPQVKMALSSNLYYKAFWTQQNNMSYFGEIMPGNYSKEFIYYFSNANDAVLSGCTKPVLSDPNNFTILSDQCDTNNMSAFSMCEVRIRANPLVSSSSTPNSMLTRQCNGTNNVSTAFSFTKASANTSIVNISAGYAHTCATLSSGIVKCWGYNSYGQLGSYTYANTTTVPQAISGLTSATQVALGQYHTCALNSDGTVRCWGTNGGQQLGVTVSGQYGDAVVGIANAIQLKSGIDGAHNCVLLSDKTVKCWGFGGRLGDGTEVSTGTPVVVSGLTNVKDLSLGSQHSCALLEDETVKCWGYNFYGQLGTNNTTNSFVPIAVPGLTNVKQVSVGGSFTCALLNDDTMKCWGYNSVGQLGIGTTVNKKIPTLVPGLSNIKEIVIGTGHACVVLNDKTLKCWGSNSSGQLGDETTINRLSPVSIIAVSDVELLTLGSEHTCAVLTDANVKCWGEEDHGRLGDLVTQAVVPTSIDSLNGLGITQIEAGRYFGCAMLNDGTVKCWGANYWDQLGDGTQKEATTPVSVVGGTSATQISTYQDHTCALINNGTVKCWGDGWYPTGNSSIVAGDRTTVTGVSDAVQVSLGVDHSCALLSDETVKCWGSNSYGELGNGTNTGSSTATVVTNLDHVKQISAAGNRTCALLNDGTVKCWGTYTSGLYADSTKTSSNVPVPVTGLTNVKQLSTSFNSACALLNDNTVKCWGYHNYVPAGSVSSDPDQLTTVTELTDVKEIAMAESWSCALLNDGYVKCWGRPNRLGTGIFNWNYYTTTPVTVIADVKYLSVTYDATFVIQNDNTVKFWGSNDVNIKGPPRIRTVNGL